MSAALVLLMLSACNPQGLRPVDDTAGHDDTGALGELVAVHVGPPRVVVPLGGEVQLAAMGVYEGHGAGDVTGEAAWLSDDSTVAAADQATPGLYHGLTTGITEVFATDHGVRSPSVEVIVTDAAVVGLALEPGALVLAEAAVVDVGCQGAFVDGSRGDVAGQVAWSSSDESVVTVDGGRVSATGSGDATLTASWSGKQATAAVEVGDGQAELRVAAIQARTGPGTATLIATLANDGDVGAPAFWLDLFVDPADDPVLGDVGEEALRVPWLGPGQSADQVFAFAAPAGDHTAWLAVDGGDEVPEGDDADNLDSTPFTTGASSGGPNLTVTGFAAQGDAGWVFWAVDVRNDGSTGVGAFWLDLWFDAASDPTGSGIGDAFHRVDGLGAGESVQADFVVATSEVVCSSCNSWVMIDINGQVGETDETDNLAGPLPVVIP